MGQYWLAVNLTKKELICPHTLGSGLKLWEQIAAHPSTGEALVILLAAMPEPRGIGDFDLTKNWHGPERVNMGTFGPMPKGYPKLAKSIIGRWAGDRIALIGDYAHATDLPKRFKADTIYGNSIYKDISLDVAKVIEHELRGQYVGEGCRNFKYYKGSGPDGILPDMILVSSLPTPVAKKSTKKITNKKRSK
jgi:hypothetical protein